LLEQAAVLRHVNRVGGLDGKASQVAGEASPGAGVLEDELISSRLAQFAGGEAVGVEDNDAARGGLGAVQEASDLEGAGVGPQGMVVDGHQGDRAVWKDGIQVMAGEALARGQEGIDQVGAVDPGGIGVIGGILAQGVGEGFERGDAIQVGDLHLGGAEQEVVVAVDEAGEKGAAMGVDGLRIGAAQGFGIAVAADEGDLVSGDGNGLGAGMEGVGGKDAGVGEEEGGGHRVSESTKKRGTLEHERRERPRKR
jgi:hypothetical protein